MSGDPPPARPRILIISLTDLARDSRVDRQIGFLKERYDVITAGVGRSAHADLEFIDLSHHTAASGARDVKRRAGSLIELLLRRYQSVYWRHPANAQALARLAGHGASVTIANDVSALPLACATAGGRPVILDAHEYAPAEQSEVLWWRLVISPYIDALLRLYLPDVAAMMTVSAGIAELYASTYGAHPVVVTNAPGGADLLPTRTGNPIRLVHHGIADRKRELERMIEVMGMVGQGFTLDLMLVPGDRRYISRLRRMAARYQGVRLIEPCRPREIVRRLNAYDVGVYLMPRRSLNQALALPNKLFEFIQARLAIAIGPSAEMANVVRSRHCGVISRDDSLSAFARIVGELTPDRVAILKWASHRAARELTAERNREIVLNLVANVRDATVRHSLSA
jgi:hypothetical protein